MITALQSQANFCERKILWNAIGTGNSLGPIPTPSCWSLGFLQTVRCSGSFCRIKRPLQPHRWVQSKSSRSRKDPVGTARNVTHQITSSELNHQIQSEFLPCRSWDSTLLPWIWSTCLWCLSVWSRRLHSTYQVFNCCIMALLAQFLEKPHMRRLTGTL